MSVLRLSRYGPPGKISCFGALQQAVGDAEIATGVLHLGGLERPRPRLQQRIVHRPAELGHPRRLPRGIIGAPLGKEEVAEVAAREDLAFGMAAALKPVGGPAIELFGTLRIACAIDVAVGERQPQVVRMLRHQPLEDLRRPRPNTLFCWATS